MKIHFEIEDRLIGYIIGSVALVLIALALFLPKDVLYNLTNMTTADSTQVEGP